MDCIICFEIKNMLTEKYISLLLIPGCYKFNLNLNIFLDNDSDDIAAITFGRLICIIYK